MSRRPSEIPAMCHTCCAMLRLQDLKVHPGTKYGTDAPVFCCDEHMEPWLKTRQAQAMLAGVAMDDLGAALWAHRRSFVWFFIASAFVGIGVRLVARSVGSDGLDEFGAGIADLSLIVAFALLAAMWFTNRKNTP